VPGGGGGGGGGTVGDSWAFANDAKNKLISNTGKYFIFFILLAILQKVQLYSQVIGI